jgi:hypothetical protein
LVRYPAPLGGVATALVDAEHSFDLGQGISQAAHVEPHRTGPAGVNPQQMAVTGVVMGV